MLFLLTIWWSQVWGDASACPYTHMEDVAEGKTSFRVMALKIWAQLMGGCCVWRFIQFFWWLEISQTHKGKAFEDCSADLQVNSTSSLLVFTNFHESIFKLGLPISGSNHRRLCNFDVQISVEGTCRIITKILKYLGQFCWNVTRCGW